MTSSIQFSGIASGLDTASIISQLMTIEQQPQNTLKSNVSAESAQVTELQSLNTALQGLVTSADSFSSGSTWTQISATSSNAAVSVSAAAGANTGNLQVTVLGTATAAETDYSKVATSLDQVVITPTGDPTKDVIGVTLPDGTTAQVSIGDGKLSTVTANLNALKDASGNRLLNASAVNDGAGNYSLMLTSTSTGSGSISLDVGGLTGSLATTTAQQIAGTNAQIQLGAGGTTVTSRSNTFTNALSGVTITVAPGTAANTSSQVTLSDTGSSRATALSAFVSQINSILTKIAADTTYGTYDSSSSTFKGAGVLAGESTLRGVATALTNTIFGANNVALGNMGISVDDNGQITFDQTAFTTAYQKDPQGVADAFTGKNGFVGRVMDAAAAASTPSYGQVVGTGANAKTYKSEGSLSMLIDSLNSQIKQQNDEIAQWDVRLAQKQQNLETTYANLETAMSNMTSQSNWLASQISGLDSLSSSNN